ncbi:hypothetical protein CERSUDRAFT_97845 [Gelatoporia subvermispora B]|uniref:Uncharacterized protein n=1 Tax=Ceriporiopsis subvermispora (strain B) TaxID=914234 RepID=M2R4W0_CERS8|nr:hypothetical protein CERSUDRAFT_97845 [Gelatoporia subvermispora B]
MSNGLAAVSLPWMRREPRGPPWVPTIVRVVIEDFRMCADAESNLYGPTRIPLEARFRDAEQLASMHKWAKVLENLKEWKRAGVEKWDILAHRNVPMAAFLVAYITGWNGRWLTVEPFSPEDRKAMCERGFFVERDDDERFVLPWDRWSKVHDYSAQLDEQRWGEREIYRVVGTDYLRTNAVVAVDLSLVRGWRGHDGFVREDGTRIVVHTVMFLCQGTRNVV